MSKAHFTRLRDMAAADKARIRNAVMRRAELALYYERTVIEHPRNTEYLACFERLVEAERWKHSRQTLGEHGLAGARRADHKNVI